MSSCSVRAPSTLCDIDSSQALEVGQAPVAAGPLQEGGEGAQKFRGLGFGAYQARGSISRLCYELQGSGILHNFGQSRLQVTKHEPKLLRAHRTKRRFVWGSDAAKKTTGPEEAGAGLGQQTVVSGIVRNPSHDDDGNDNSKVLAALFPPSLA